MTLFRSLLFASAVLGCIVGAQSGNYFYTSVVEGTPDGFYVSVTDNNFAILSPILEEFLWKALTVNGDNIVILLTNKTTIATTFNALNKTERNFITDTQKLIAQNFKGLSLKSMQKYPTSSYPGGYGYKPYSKRTNSQYGVSYPSNNYNTSNYLSGANCASTDFNYHNLINTQLNLTLAGDVYDFDSLNHILDVYSDSVSVSQQCGESILFRDQRYFSYSYIGMPFGINRIFLKNSYLFIVYNDGVVLIKSRGVYKELDLLVKARARIKKILKNQDAAAKAMSSS